MSFPLTARQRAVVDAVERTGSIESAARELGVTGQSVGATYRRAMARSGDYTRPERAPRPPTAREVTALLPDRMAAIETHLESLLADQAATAVLLSNLASEIRAWTSRQPVYVEVRPRHDRKADGGLGGVREARQLRKVAT